MRPILKYPGSKQRIAGWIIEKMPKHHSYLEPFLGSGAVLFNKKPSNIETVNDLDDEVVNLFNIVREDSERLIKKIALTPYSRKEYDLAFEETEDKHEKARRFLIRCWQGHGFRTMGSKPGWKNDVQGREAAYAVRNWNRLPQNILDVIERLKGVQIENTLAIDVIKRFNHENVLIYCDPPYVLSTRTAKQYKHEMTECDHEALLNVLLSSKAAVMISGYECELYEDLLKGWRKEKIATTAEYGLARDECLWMNFDLEVRQMRMEVGR